LEKVRFGKTDMMVSRLGFGGIPIQRVSEDEAVAVVRKCVELDINFIDTANAYTTSEERVGKAIAGCREDLIVATKTIERTPDAVAAHLKLSLERMQTDYIDLYQFHNVSDPAAVAAICDPNGPMAVVAEAKRQGVVRHIGVTSHSLDMSKELVKTDLFETIMFPLNFITSEATEELLPMVEERDMGFIAMKPLEGGRLSNVALAFKYLYQFPRVVTIVGIEKEEEIVEIADILKGPMGITEADKLEMERYRQELGKVFCRRCNYCQPCTQEIPIAIVMDFPSLFLRLPPHRIFSGFIAEAMEKAATCIKCGDCEERCPYGLPIQDMVEDYAGRYQAEKAKYSG